MLIQICKKQKELQARKKYKENISNINSLDDACNRLDDLKREMGDMDCRYMRRHMEELSLIQDEMIEEMRFCEEENLDICEEYEEREKVYESV